jgi:hypothetical protein
VGKENRFIFLWSLQKQVFFIPQGVVSLREMNWTQARFKDPQPIIFYSFRLTTVLYMECAPLALDPIRPGIQCMVDFDVSVAISAMRENDGPGDDQS